jgi:hypothetical protein
MVLVCCFVRGLSVLFSLFFLCCLACRVFCVVGRVVFCGVVLCNYQPKDRERMVVEMMYRQDIKNEVVDYIRNSGERVADYNVNVIDDSVYE